MESTDTTGNADDASDEDIESPPSSPAKGMTGVQLFPPEKSGTTTLALLSTPKKHRNKRQKPTSSPPPKSNLRPQYKETSGASGGEKC
jgi:hypothetical protein